MGAVRRANENLLMGAVRRTNENLLMGTECMQTGTVAT